MHGEFLRQQSKDANLASQIMHDYRTADIDDVLRAMLDYAAKLTKEPSSMQEADVEGLREVGLSDEEILSVVLVVCNYAFMTRLADGLGVEVPKRHSDQVARWLTGPARDYEWLMKSHEDR